MVICLAPVARREPPVPQYIHIADEPLFMRAVVWDRLSSGAGASVHFHTSRRNQYMRNEITQPAADLMNKVDAARKVLKNDIADMQQMIENTNRTIAVAKLTLAHLEMARDANCAQASRPRPIFK